ncbi:hypothetical protein FB451DRAFT_1460551 [Mycena latifolia]|nr:hypothetical protein FB451DRAFT_1460551 [Mycena latifolia]
MQFLKDEPLFLSDPPAAPASVPARPPARSSPSPITPEAVTTSFAAKFVHSADNSVVRHRRLPRQEEQHSYPPSQNSAPNPVDHHPSAPGGRGIANPAERSARSVGEYLRIVHMFIIAPPFFHDQADLWNLERLDHRLNAFQSWVLTANGGLLAQCTCSNPRTFQYLEQSCCSELRHTGRNSKLQQERAEGMDRSRSSWTPSTAMCLPLAWMAWSIVSLLFSLITLGVQGFVSALRRLSSSNDPIASAIINASNSPLPTPALFNIFQLGAFTLAIVWSSVPHVLAGVAIAYGPTINFCCEGSQDVCDTRRRIFAFDTVTYAPILEKSVPSKFPPTSHPRHLPVLAPSTRRRIEVRYSWGGCVDADGGQQRPFVERVKAIRHPAIGRTMLSLPVAEEEEECITAEVPIRNKQVLYLRTLRPNVPAIFSSFITTLLNVASSLDPLSPLTRDRSRSLSALTSSHHRWHCYLIAIQSFTFTNHLEDAIHAMFVCKHNPLLLIRDKFFQKLFKTLPELRGAYSDPALFFKDLLVKPEIIRLLGKLAYDSFEIFYKEPMLVINPALYAPNQ